MTLSPIDDGVHNSTGIVTKSLADLQRLLVCRYAANPDAVCNSMKKNFKTVIGSSSVSARVTMIMKANTYIRTAITMSQRVARCK